MLIYIRTSILKLSSPDVPLVSSTTLFESTLCFSSLLVAPFAAQLHRICLLPSHFPVISNQGL